MTSTSSYPSVQFGAMLIGSPETQGRINTLKDAQEVLDILRAHKVDSIDTARFYGNGSSEKYLGELKAQEQGFKISTKLMPILGTPLAGLPNISNNQYDHGAQSVHAACQASLDDLKMEKIDIYYLHAPDKNTQFKETLAAIDQEYRAGRFERFGISNFTVEQVKEIVSLCEQHSFVPVSVYQGMYNAIARKSEETLFPTLRANNIAFVAFSPAAGGFFTMKEQTDEVGPNHRFDKDTPHGQMYRGLYWDEKYFKVLRTFRPLAEKYDIGMIEMALRWCKYHSGLKQAHGDTLLLGASSPSQLETNLTNLEKGPLPKELVDALEEAWMTLKESSFAMEETFA